jgi:hypothetical protein
LGDGLFYFPARNVFKFVDRLPEIFVFFFFVFFHIPLQSSSSNASWKSFWGRLSVNKLRTIIILLSAAFFVPILAQADNLWTSPGSFQITADSQPSAYELEFAKVSKKKHVEETPDTDQPSGTVFDDSQLFAQIYSGYDFSSLGDLASGTSAWINYGKSQGVATSGGANNSGILAGAQFGFHLNPTSSLSLDLGSVFTLSNGFTLTGSGSSLSQTLDPMLLSTSIDYTLDIVKNAGSHTYISVGAGWYHASVNYELSETSPATVLGQGTYTGDTIGGTLAIGEEVDLGGSFGFDFSVRGRYASFSRVSSNSGTSFDGGGTPASLAIVSSTFPGYNVLLPVSNAGIDANPGMARYAVLDYTGIDAKLGLSLYFN